MFNPSRLFFLIAGFAMVPQAIGKLPEIPETEAEHCRYIGEISANSGYGKNPNWQPIAKTYAEKKAESLGATHVARIQYKPGGTFNGEAQLKAYVCP